jgi:hypothetical protein
MRRSTAALAVCLLSLGALAVMVACRGGDAVKPDPCYPIINGLVAYNQGIDLLVRDASGRGQAFGDTAIAYRGQDSLIARGYDTLHLSTGFGAPGTYTVRVKRKFYRDAVVSNVTVVAGVCGGPVATVVPVSLELAAGAPALRSLMVFGATFLYAPGAQSQLFGRFDADPSVPTTVTWRLSDTTAARIDSFGVVTAKCTVAKGVVDTVTAIATADTTVKAIAIVGVAQQTTCP